MHEATFPLLEAQPPKHLRHVEVRLRRARRLPGEITAIGIFADAAKQINAPALALLRLVNPMIPGNAHGDRDAIIFHFCGGGHVRVKFPI